MIGRKHWTLTLLLTSLFALTVAASAAAGGPSHGGPARGGFAGARPGRGIHSSGLLRELIYPCQSACGDTSKSCYEAADAEALTCVSAACAPEIEAAQTACGEDSRSDECHDAISDLRDCGDSCLDTRATAVSACREALVDCFDACNPDE